MAIMPAGITQDDLDRYAQLTAGIRALGEEQKILNAKIKQAYEDAGISGKKAFVYPSAKYGAVIVKLGEQRRVDTEGLASKYPMGDFPTYWKCSINPATIPADLVDEFRTEVTMTLSVDRENDGNESPRRAQR